MSIRLTIWPLERFAGPSLEAEAVERDFAPLRSAGPLLAQSPRCSRPGGHGSTAPRDLVVAMAGGRHAARDVACVLEEEDEELVDDGRAALQSDRRSSSENCSTSYESSRMPAEPRPGPWRR